MGIIMKNKVCYSNGGNTTIQPVIYSDTEREIGVWRDGKPLYQITKVFSSTQVLTTSNLELPDFTISDVDKVINAEAAEHSVNDTTFVAAYVMIDKTNGKVYAKLQAGQQGIHAITICYTKTTDTPGSGTWTPSGVPAVHYSTDEQIVGTWIDGSALYQITKVYQNVSISSNDHITLESAWGMELVHAFGFLKENGNRYALPETSIRIFVSSSGDLELASKTSNWNGDLYVTLQYTKSTS